MFSPKLLGNKFLAASLFSVILIIAFGTDNSNGKTNNILSICSGESRGSGIGFVSFQQCLESYIQSLYQQDEVED